jgi:hypothetical protein
VLAKESGRLSLVGTTASNYRAAHSARDVVLLMLLGVLPCENPELYGVLMSGLVLFGAVGAWFLGRQMGIVSERMRNIKSSPSACRRVVGVVRAAEVAGNSPSRELARFLCIDDKKTPPIEEPSSIGG